jgi:hypothetical protein
VKITGKRIALAVTCVGILVLLLAAFVSRNWILEKLHFPKPEPTWAPRIRAKLDQQIVTLSVPGGHVDQVLPILSEITGIKIVIDPDVDARRHIVNLKVKDMKASDVLSQIMDQTGLTYEFKDDGIFVKEKA